MSSEIMLQNAAVGEDASSSSAGIYEMIETAWRLVLRQWWIITLGLLAGVAAAWTFLSIVPIYYQATATILLDPRRVQLFQQPTVFGDEGRADDVDGQIVLLHSSSIAQKVISALNLADDPEFRGQIGFGASKRAEGALNEREMLARFDQRLTVRRVGGTFALDISFEAEDPKKAATIANAVVDAYARDQADEKKGVLRQTGGWLGDRLRELRQQTTEAEEAVNSFRVKNGLVDAGEGRTMVEQRVLELNSLLVDARGRTAEARAELAHSDTALKAISRSPTTWHASELINNQAAIKLREQYLELAQREADWRKKYGANHEAVKQLDQQMDDIRRAMLDELTRVRESNKSKLDLAIQREKDVSEELDKAIAKSQAAQSASVKQRELESTAQTYRAVYDNFLRQHAQSVEQISFPSIDARVITRATEPLSKTWKKPLRRSALIFCFFSGLGLGLALLRDFSDRSFRTPKDVQAKLGVPCISMVPFWRRKVGAGISRWWWSKRLKSKGKPADGQSSINIESDPLRAALEFPFSHYSEAIRTIKVTTDRYGAKVIAFASALPGEGSSTIAAAFAFTLAQSGAQTVLLDLDLRNPRLSRELTPTAEKGIAEVIMGSTTLDSAVWTAALGPLVFLPAGKKAQLGRPEQLLRSKALGQIFDLLRDTYEYIIVDLPPLAPMLDVAITTPLLDALVLVIDWGNTRQQAVADALDYTPVLRDRLVGAVLNRVKLNKLNRYDSNQALLYNPKLYARYRYTNTRQELVLLDEQFSTIDPEGNREALRLTSKGSPPA